MMCIYDDIIIVAFSFLIISVVPSVLPLM